MRVKYLLPCPCGKEVPVDTTQAGQSVECECGQSMEVPTLKGLRALQQVAPDQPTPRKSAEWGARQATFVVGLVITLIGGSMVLRFYSARPTEVGYAQQVQRLSPRQTWDLWQNLRTGARVPAFTRDPFAEVVSYYRLWMAMAIAVAVLGVAITASSWLIPKPGHPKPPNRGRPTG